MFYQYMPLEYRNSPTSCNGYSKKREVLLSITAFDVVILVQTLQRVQTITNSVIEVLRFTLFTCCCYKEQ